MFPFFHAVVLGFRMWRRRNLFKGISFRKINTVLLASVMRLCKGCVNKWLFEVPADLQANVSKLLSAPLSLVVQHKYCTQHD